MATPLAKSTPLTQSLQKPMISAALPHLRDILEPHLNEQVRSTYLERQMRQMESVKLPSGMPSLKDGMVPRPESLQDWIQKVLLRRERLKEKKNGNLKGKLWRE